MPLPWEAVPCPGSDRIGQCLNALTPHRLDGALFPVVLCMQIPDAPALNLTHATLLPGGVNAMIGARLPANEDERVQALHAYRLLDTAPEPSYDAVTAIAAAVCRMPMALISLVDTHRQWFKSRLGMQQSETPRELSFCAHAILQPDQVMEVGDTHLDERFVRNALVTGEPQIRFYAGAPLLTPDGIAQGTLCVLDRVPRPSAMRCKPWPSKSSAPSNCNRPRGWWSWTHCATRLPGNGIAPG